ncbi:DUF6569 family protein [Nocardioides sp. GY 10127]|uniref:ARPP-1 family domain-containing protein n=1 Tax=Nocardioides sp. GY 10127 TaxID=2569762 RepID=UPI0010A7A9BD|nr:DUF6569 family protein [Nocardioides sp. GY 10127]TIC84431.1 hypothetical protein E8D37_06615 [Nocardioides sp. GY 10127]
MIDLHVGRGTSRGAITVFPLWSATPAPAGTSVQYTADPRHLDVRELADGPQVSLLDVGNTASRPALVLGGQLFEGGWQHRMARRSTLIAAGERQQVEVACVEAGRWSGESAQRSLGRRATPLVRDAVRTGRDVQSEVWGRVARHTGRLPGAGNETGSLVRHLDASELDRAALVPDVLPLPGQVGVLIGLGGQPYLAEVFDSPDTLAVQLPALLAAVAADAALAPQVPTPGRRARRFVGRALPLELRETGPAGVGTRCEAAHEHVVAEALRHLDRDLHLLLTNPRHPLLTRPMA